MRLHGGLYSTHKSKMQGRKEYELLTAGRGWKGKLTVAEGGRDSYTEVRPSCSGKGQVNADRGYSNAINVGAGTDVTANVNNTTIKTRSNKLPFPTFHLLSKQMNCNILHQEFASTLPKS
jgi:hypothetical protein